MHRERLTIVWLHGGSCDGCTMSVLGATSPRLEELLAGAHSPSRLELVHPHFALDAGDAYVQLLEGACRGDLGAFLLVVEGSMFDGALAGSGHFSQIGRREGEPVTAEQWVVDLAAGAQAVVAIGTCAAWGGIPAAAGNVTGAMGVGALLGAGFRGRGGLPLIVVPGCAPSGEAFLETIQYLVLHLEGVVPFDLDTHGRPRWVYAEQTPLVGVRTGFGDRVPVPDETAGCPVPARGWINRLGGCASVGGDCIGCTRPDFPDRTLPLVRAVSG